MHICNLKQSILFILFTAVTLNAFATDSQAATPLTAEMALQDFIKVSSCTERIWPDYKWAGTKILVYAADQKIQKVVDIDSKIISVFDATAFPQVQSTFSFFEFQNQKVMSVNMEFTKYNKEDHAVLGLGVHEAFHQIIQTDNKKWVWSAGAGARGTQIPIRWQPRFYRAMLEKELSLALINPTLQDESLAKARYWYDLWTTEYPDEVKSTTDGYEGTAMYAEHLGVVFAEEGCDISEKVLREKVASRIQKKLATSSLLSYAGMGGADGEGYPIGSLASFILRFDRNQKNWNEEVVLGKTPLQILMSQVSASTKSEVSELQTAPFKSAAQQSQASVDGYLAKTIQNLSTADSIMVTIPSSWRAGSTGYRGFFNDLKNNMSFAVFSENVLFQSQKSKIEVDPELASFNKLDGTPCSSQGWTFAIQASELKMENIKQYTINSQHIRGRMEAELSVQAAGGKKWLCGVN